MKKRDLLIAAGLIAFGCLVGFGVKALADGIPSPNPLYYAGTLTENGALANGSHSITINLWLNPAPTTGETNLCATNVAGAPVVNGRFRIALASSCKAAINANPNTYVEVVDNGTSLGRASIGAVPYAVEADHAVNATNAVDGGSLSTALTSLQQSVTTLKGNLVAVGAYVTNNGTTATVANQLGGTWLTGATRVSAGDVTLQIATGFFPASNHELCVATPNANTTNGAFSATLPFVVDTGIQVNTFSGTTITDSDFLVVCVGPAP